MIGALLEDYPLLLDATVLEPNRGLAEISTGCINAIVIIIIIIVVVVVAVTVVIDDDVATGFSCCHILSYTIGDHIFR